MRKIIVAAACLVFSLHAFAQDGTVHISATSKEGVTVLKTTLLRP